MMKLKFRFELELKYVSMETRNLLIQIALLVLGGLILFKVFQMDANQKIIKNSIEKSLENIASAEENLATALDEITKLEEQIEVFKAQRDLLEKERETIVKNYQEAQEEDREVIDKIKEEIEKNNDELDRLRELNEKFAGSSDNQLVTEPVIKLKDLIKKASGKLKEYRTE